MTSARTAVGAALGLGLGVYALPQLVMWLLGIGLGGPIAGGAAAAAQAMAAGSIAGAGLLKGCFWAVAQSWVMTGGFVAKPIVAGVAGLGGWLGYRWPQQRSPQRRPGEQQQPHGAHI